MRFLGKLHAHGMTRRRPPVSPDLAVALLLLGYMNKKIDQLEWRREDVPNAMLIKAVAGVF